MKKQNKTISTKKLEAIIRKSSRENSQEIRSEIQDDDFWDYTPNNLGAYSNLIDQYNTEMSQRLSLH